jgi:hypothetical protein
VGWDLVHLVRWPIIGLSYQPRIIDECGAVGEIRIGRGNRSTRRKPALVPLCPQIPHDLIRARNRADAVGNRRLTAWAMALPTWFYIFITCSSQPAAYSLYRLNYRGMMINN